MKVSAQLVVRIEPKIKRDLHRVAKRLDTTIQGAVNEALRQWVERQDGQQQAAE